jgi:hypothetical protein
MSLQHIFAAVPALNRKAETRSADLDVRPAASPLGVQEVGDAGTAADKLPTAIGLFADQAVAGTCISVAIGTAFGDDRLRAAVTIEVAHFLNRPRCEVGCAGVVAGTPLLALERVPGRFYAAASSAVGSCAGDTSADTQNSNIDMANKMFSFTGYPSFFKRLFTLSRTCDDSER